MTAFELVSFVLAAYLAAAVILGACALASWLDQDARRRNGGV
jgi:hypothetical protein